ncbi:MAG: type II toxin-antitoxin system RelE/ParE family toxin [Pyrinomonadaceae bacterium]
MRYSVEIRSDDLADIAEASTWYEEREPGLGIEFVRAVREAIGNLPANPLAHRLRNRRRNVRWFLPPRFPYRIVYRVQGELIIIIAVLHAARHDRHWKERV